MKTWRGVRNLAQLLAQTPIGDGGTMRDWRTSAIAQDVWVRIMDFCGVRSQTAFEIAEAVKKLDAKKTVTVEQLSKILPDLPIPVLRKVFEQYCRFGAW